MLIRMNFLVQFLSLLSHLFRQLFAFLSPPARGIVQKLIKKQKKCYERGKSDYSNEVRRLMLNCDFWFAESFASDEIELESSARPRTVVVWLRVSELHEIFPWTATALTFEQIFCGRFFRYRVQRDQDFRRSFSRSVLCWFRWNFLHTFEGTNIDETNLAQWKNVKRRRLTAAETNSDEHLFLALLSRQLKSDDTGESFSSQIFSSLPLCVDWREWQKCLFKCLSWNFSENFRSSFLRLFYLRNCQ